MTTNPILDSIRETRERLLVESGGTVAGLVQRLQAEEKASGRPIRQPRRTTQRTEPAKPAVAAMEGHSPKPDDR